MSLEGDDALKEVVILTPLHPEDGVRALNPEHVAEFADRPAEPICDLLRQAPGEAQLGDRGFPPVRGLARGLCEPLKPREVANRPAGRGRRAEVAPAFVTPVPLAGRLDDDGVEVARVAL